MIVGNVCDCCGNLFISNLELLILLQRFSVCISGHQKIIIGIQSGSHEKLNRNVVFS